MTNIKYQNHSHFKLPITINPLEYGTLIEQIGNKYIIQLNTFNILIINEKDNENFIKLFRKGEFVFEFKDLKISENSFARFIQDQKYTFKNSKLVSTEILSVYGNILIYQLHEDTNSIQLTPYLEHHKDKLIKYLASKSANIYKNYFAELFLVFLVYLIFFIILIEDNINTSLATMSMYNTIKLRKTKSKNVWNELSYNFGNKIFTTYLFKSKFNQFWSNISAEFNDNNHLFILFKIKYVNSEYVSIGKLQRLNLADKNWYIDFILENMKFKSEYYNETQIESIIFSYGFKKGKIPNKETIDLNVNSIIINEMTIPISINPFDFGRLSKVIEIENRKLYIVQNNKGETIMIFKFDKFNEVEYLKDGISLIKFRDEIISENKFVRIINNKKYYFENKDQILFSKELNTKFIAKTPKSNKLTNKFITLDIETFIKDNILIPFCISIYDGKKLNNFFISDYNNVEDMILDSLKSIMIRKYHGYNVYMHNMAKFDIIFLFKYLIKLGMVKPIIHNDRIITINFQFGENNEYQIKFRDSLLLLLQSLDTLSKSFKVDNSKSKFPIFFVNENNLNYSGEVPDIKYFNNISKKDFESYKAKFSNNWNLKNEAIKYCNIDCISLYQVLFKNFLILFWVFLKSNLYKVIVQNHS